MHKSLSLLPCFNHIERIDPIHLGFSHTCFKVFADNKVYFAKVILKHSIETKVLSALITSNNNISPIVIFKSEQWLIMPYISAENLLVNNQSLDSKIELSMELITKFHPLDIKLEPLKPFIIIDELTSKKNYSAEQQKYFLQIKALLKESLLFGANKSDVNIVSCHGDLNFSNVLFDSRTKQKWLIDFECSCFAPIEYDLAMFIAINNLNVNMIPMVINHYQKHHATAVIDQKLIKHYLLFCYFINGLWFFNNAELKSPTEKNKAKQLSLLAKKQWQALDNLIRIESGDSSAYMPITLQDSGFS